MMMLLDTTVLVDALRARNGRRRLRAGLVEGGHTLATSAVNIAEVYAGMRPEEAEATDSFLSRLEFYPTTYEVAQRAGELKYSWAKKGRTISLADMLVAATALENHLPLMTDNVKDFPQDELTFHPLF